MNILDKIKDEKHTFYIFLAIHFIVWSCVGLIRTVLPTDALEGIYWGSFMDWGTPKHPPLFGWLAYFTYIPFKFDYMIYFVSQLFIILGFVYIYKLAKYFLDETRAILSVIVLEGCWTYSYITGYYGFNPDVIILFTLPAICFYFCKCMDKNNGIDWIKLGLLVGLSFLNKYQTALIVIPLFIWCILFKKDVFKNKFFYISAGIATIILAPHILWLYKYDFFPFLYFDGELTASSWINHIIAPLNFALMQLVVTIGVWVIYTALKIKVKSPFKLCLDYEKNKIWFLLLICFTSFAIHFSMGLIEGGTMRPRWGYEFWFPLGILLFYLFPCKIDKEAFKFTLKCAYAVMLIILISLGTLLTVEKNYRSRYPVNTVYSDLKRFWQENCNTELKYLGGYIEWTLPLSVYTEDHPKVLLDTYGYPDPWTDYQKLKKSGVMIIERTVENVVKQTIKSIPYLDKNIKIKPIEYKFMVYNALGKGREYTIYYYIIKPE